jgi:hypothetical protein
MSLTKALIAPGRTGITITAALIGSKPAAKVPGSANRAADIRRLDGADEIVNTA